MITKLITKLERMLIAGTDPGSGLTPAIDAQQLEERILYSAAPMVEPPEPDDSASIDHGIFADEQAASGADLSATEHENGPSNSSPETLLASDIALPSNLRLELVFVDAGVGDVQTLIQDFAAGDDPTRLVEFVLLDAQRDGIEQISQTLSQHSGVDAVHLVSHGDGEGIQLGNTYLDMTSATGRAGEIASWGNSLDVDADILIYGCDLASTAEGQTLIDSIGALCDCDVAASDDVTGHEDLGGDWVLEYTANQIGEN